MTPSVSRPAVRVFHALIVAAVTIVGTSCRQESKQSTTGGSAMSPADADQARTLRAYLGQHPDDPAALYNLAQLYAVAGNRDSALSLLSAMADAHTGLDPKGSALRSFKTLATDPQFEALVAQVERENPPIGSATPMLTIREPDLAPEGIAYDPVDRVFYVSSIAKHKILRLGRDGSVSDFKTSGQDGLGATLGMKVDAARRTLWVVSDPPGPVVNQPATSSTSAGAVFQYDLRTGSLRYKHELPPGGGFLNDVAIRSTGEAFATNTGTGAVYRMSPDHDGADVFLPANTVGQANGIALSDDERALFVAGWLGVARVDLTSNQVKLLAKAHNVSDAGLDGMYAHKGSIVGIQNPDLHPGRVMRYVLNAAADSIVGADVLDSYDPLVEGPTTGTVLGDTLYFVANPQLDKFLDLHPPAPFDSLRPLTLVKLHM